MLNVFLKIHEISFAQSINIWIYYIKKIPIIGKFIPESIYGASKSKVILGNIIRVLIFLWSFIRKFLHILFVIILPILLIGKVEGDYEGAKFYLFFFLSFILGSFMDNKFTIGISKDFYMINIMRFDPKKYYLGKILFSYIGYFICFLFPIKFLGVSFIEALIITLEFIAFRAIVQSFYLLFSDKKGFQLSSKIYFLLSICIGSVVIAYGGIYLGLFYNFKKLFLNPIFIVITLGLAIISLVYLIKYDKYKLLSKKIVSIDEINRVNTMTNEAIFTDVKINDKKINEYDLLNDKHKNKEGLNYLNAKFLERHKRIMIKPIKLKSLMILAIVVILATITIIFPKVHNDINNFILSSSGTLIFVMYILSIGEKATRAFFFNCDNSLLRYSFYRDPKIILESFKSRLKIVILLNLIPALFIAMGIFIITILAKGTVIKVIPIAIITISLSIFFSVHYLFLYYITQPYTMQLTIKSPVYKVVSGIVYCLSCMALQIDKPSEEFTIFIILLTVIYVLLSLCLVYKYATKNFRLKH